MEVSHKCIITEAELCMFYDEKSRLHTQHRYIKNSLLCTLSITDKLCLGSSLTMCNVFLIQEGIIRIMLALGPRALVDMGLRNYTQ
jgi:hypothetical protein